MKYILISVFILSLYSCKKIDLMEVKDKMAILSNTGNFTVMPESTSDTLENSILLLFKEEPIIDPVNSSTKSYGVTIGAAFHDFSDNIVNVGNLYINGNSIGYLNDNSYRYTSDNNTMSAGTCECSYPSLTNLYGQNVIVGIDGNSLYDSFTDTVKAPTHINFSTDMPYGDAYIHGSAVTLNWSTDASNQFGKVLIQCYYYSSLSKSNDSNCPDNVSAIETVVSDNGSYTFSSTQLTDFPVNGYLGFTVSRMNQYEDSMALSTKKVMIITIATASSGPILILGGIRPVYVKLERTNDYYYSDPYTTIESTNYVTRFYMEGAAAMPTALAMDLTVNYSYSSHQWYDYSSSTNDYSSTGSFTGSTGTNQNDTDIGYVELYYYADGVHTTQEISLTSGSYYNIIN